jgi:hypothetical protein
LLEKPRLVELLLWDTVDEQNGYPKWSLPYPGAQFEIIDAKSAKLFITGFTH